MKKELYEASYQNQKHFSFGKNWQNFLQGFSEKNLENAKQSLVDFLGGSEKISGKTFVDIGCGSGLFSLAAYQLGAKKVVSVDVDASSIQCAKHLHQKANSPENWKILPGSALDKEFIQSLGTFDIVYSWGVLHHTGDMHTALNNITSLMHESGTLYIAIYNDNQRKCEGTSSVWLKIKKLYNSLPWIGKKAMEIIYGAYYISGLALSGKNPWHYIKNYQSLRGMNFFTDIKDWLGGYPYEFATPQEIIDFFSPLGLRCAKIQPARSIGCNEFLFVKNP